MKEVLCKAFCNDIIVNEVPIGLAIGTAFRRDDGDRIYFYVVSEEGDKIRLEDDGATIPILEEAGVDFETDTRRRALEALLIGVDAYYDATDSTIRTRSFDKDHLGNRALDFVSLMIRMGDFLLLTQEKVASNFRDDAALKIRQAIGDRALIRESEAVSKRLSEVRPDMIVEAPSRPPVAIFFGTSSARVNDAIFLHLTALHEFKEHLSVVALLEEDNSIPSELRRRASNRLATVPVFRQDEEAAVSRIAREALGVAA